MNEPARSCRRAWILIAACCFSVGTAVAAAQMLDEIVVTAERMTSTTVVGRSPTTGAPVELVSLTHRVDYRDLDLTRHADVLTLRRRVKDAATTACRQLDRLYPVSAPRSEACTRKAVEDAQAQIDQAIGQAASHAGHG